MVLQEMRSSLNKLTARVEQKLLNSGRILCHQMIVEPLVVSEIKPELLQTCFQVPINPREKQKFWILLPHSANRLRPKLGFGTRGSGGIFFPCCGKHLLEQKHRHI